MDPEDDTVRVSATELIPAIDRTTRTIVMAIDAAIKRLESMGYDRKNDIGIVDDESSFPGVTLGDRYVFGIVSRVVEGRIVMDGEWLVDVKPLHWLKRWWRERRRARAS